MIESLTRRHWLKTHDRVDDSLFKSRVLTKGSLVTIYFIQSQDNQGLIKIGITQNLKTRFAALSMASPSILKVIKTVPGSTEEESRLHTKFKKERRHGEWFFPSQELLNFIENYNGLDVSKVSDY